MKEASSAQRRLLDLRSLALFSAVRREPVLAALDGLLEALAVPEAAPESLAAAWAAFSGRLAGSAGAPSLRASVAEIAAADENPFTLAAERSGAASLSGPLGAAARADLRRLARIAAIDVATLAGEIAARLRDAGFAEAAADMSAQGAVAQGAVAPRAAAALAASADWAAAAEPFAEAIRASGAGLLGLHRSFVWTGSAGNVPGRTALLPVRHADPIGLADLSGYEDQRNVVVDNTLRFLDGKPANNLLLYGDRGTGKSATVKAVCNEYADRALRLIEVRKNELPRFAEILQVLADRASRFVVFVDDLTFEKTDDAYTGLKALLEGGAEEKPENVVVYATSNRRHLVKERFADRPTTAAAALAAETGDVRAFDSLQEQLSLADRFGVTIVFAAPLQEEYLRIAEFIAESRALLPAPDSAGAAEARKRFRADALRWERWFNGRSPRTARQFVDWIEGGAGFPWE